MSAYEFEVGSVHGRFQPFHNGHLEYLEEGLRRCARLIVGITQYHRRRLIQVASSVAAHRALPGNNPLSYFERVRIVEAVTQSLGVTRDRVLVVPFPIEEPAELPDFLPTSVPVLTTTYDDWNRKKIEDLERVGYQVINLWTRTEKAFSGHVIRKLIADGDPSWHGMVPAAVIKIIEELEIGSRINELNVASPPI